MLPMLWGKAGDIGRSRRHACKSVANMCASKRARNKRTVLRGKWSTSGVAVVMVKREDIGVEVKVRDRSQSRYFSLGLVDIYLSRQVCCLWEANNASNLSRAPSLQHPLVSMHASWEASSRVPNSLHQRWIRILRCLHILVPPFPR